MRDTEKSNGIFSKFIARLRDDKRLELTVYASIFAAAFIIFVTAGGISCDGKDARTHIDAQPISVVEAENRFRSERETEEELESILSGISGAGKVKVMIMFESTSELVPALELQNSSGASGESSGSSPAKASRDGSEEPIVLTELCPKVRGVIVIAEGASDIRVKTDLTEAVRALLGVEAGQIGVFTMQRR